MIKRKTLEKKKKIEKVVIEDIDLKSNESYPSGNAKLTLLPAFFLNPCTNGIRFSVHTCNDHATVQYSCMDVPNFVTNIRFTHFHIPTHIIAQVHTNPI